MDARVTGRLTATMTVWLTAALALTGDRASSAEEAHPGGERTDEFIVIVNPGNRLRAVSHAFLRAAFLRKATTWSSGETIRPVELGKRFAARARFARKVLRKTPAQRRAYWTQQIFSGKGIPPPEADSEAAMIAYVRRHPGAVGYLPVTADPEGLIVLAIR
jgi:hypothetical protein